MKAQFHLARHGYVETLCGVSFASMPSSEVTIALHDETCTTCLEVRAKIDRKHAFGFGHALLVGIAERAA